MLSLRQIKLIRSLGTKKGRTESGLCLVEGKKNVAEAKPFLEFTFTAADTPLFAKLVGTVTPQPIAGVARIPHYSEKDILKKKTVVVLDGVQDPGNVGTILRLCLGFDASLILVESADPANPKVIRASAGAFFKVPWLEMSRLGAKQRLLNLGLPVIKLEAKPKSVKVTHTYISRLPERFMLLAGSEGQGISLAMPGTSLQIKHNTQLESLNVAQALAIILAQVYDRP